MVREASLCAELHFAYPQVLDPRKDVDGFHPLNMGWVREVESKADWEGAGANGQNTVWHNCAGG